MSDSGAGFKAVTDRIKLVLDLSSDAALADRLGFSARAWSQRKNRDRLPVAEIDALIAREELSPKFVYYGEGPVHVPLDDIDWRGGFDVRLSKVLRDPTLEIKLRPDFVEKDLTPIIKRKKDPPLHLLRELRRHGVDLHSLFSDEPTPTPAERQVVMRYRQASDAGKALIEHVAAYCGQGEPASDGTAGR